MPETPAVQPAPDNRFIRVGSLQICYQVVHAQQPSGLPVIFTHGGGPGATSWNNFLFNSEAFSRTHDCIFVDLPGYGGSDFCRVEGPVFSWYADKFIEILNELKIEKAHFVNQSFGGSMAVKVATLVPERVGCLVLSGSRPVLGGILNPIVATRARQAVETYYGGSGPSEQKMRDLIADLEFFDSEAITDTVAKSRYEISIKPSVRTFLSDPEMRGVPESLFESFRDVSAPTLIVHGLHDAFTSIDVPIMMLNQFKNARLHVINRAGHHVQTECHREYNDVVIPFLS